MKRYVKLLEHTMPEEDFYGIEVMVEAIFDEDRNLDLINAPLERMGWIPNNDQAHEGTLAYEKISSTDFDGIPVGITLSFRLETSNKGWKEYRDEDVVIDPIVILIVDGGTLMPGGIAAHSEMEDMDLPGLAKKYVLELKKRDNEGTVLSWVTERLRETAIQAVDEARFVMSDNIDQIPDFQEWQRIFDILYDGDASFFPGGQEGINRLAIKFRRDMKAKRLFGI